MLLVVGFRITQQNNAMLCYDEAKIFYEADRQCRRRRRRRVFCTETDQKSL